MRSASAFWSDGDALLAKPSRRRSSSASSTHPKKPPFLPLPLTQALPIGPRKPLLLREQCWSRTEVGALRPRVVLLDGCRRQAAIQCRFHRDDGKAPQGHLLER